MGRLMGCPIYLYATSKRARNTAPFSNWGLSLSHFHDTTRIVLYMSSSYMEPSSTTESGVQAVITICMIDYNIDAILILCDPSCQSAWFFGSKWYILPCHGSLIYTSHPTASISLVLVGRDQALGRRLSLVESPGFDAALKQLIQLCG
jgi:hypothetical protein